MDITITKIQELIEDKLTKYFATSHKNATPMQMYKAAVIVIRDILLKKKQVNNAEIARKQKKRVYYLCMEFLIGRSLRNNLFNLGIESKFRKALKGFGTDLDEMYELESDAGLGNGGLGRLAACFMDALATENYPAMGFSLRYEYGLFKQKIVDNQQVELPDLWLDSGEAWMMPRSDKHFTVKFGGRVIEHWESGKLKTEHVDATVVEAIPCDVMTSGYDSNGVSVLRLWRATTQNTFDMKSFTQGDYVTAMRAENEAQLITKVLYPSDDHFEGKQLRLTQQYFLCSASLQSIFKDHLKVYGTLDNIHEKVAIHINDTHPALAIPEMMRLLLDEYGYAWERAWYMTINTIAYTNHTVMAEALEKWGEDLVKTRLPRIYKIIKEIDARFCGEHTDCYEDKIARMCVLGNGQVRMANLSVIGSHSINGVSALHSEIIKDSVFKDFHDILPLRFTNVTNGIAHRRWLCQANPALTKFIDSLIGDGYKKDASQLIKLLEFENDANVLEKIGQIKQSNKDDFAKYVKKTMGVTLNPNSRFDTQIKRLHEYKRQLLNVLKIIDLYIDIKENPNKEVTPQTFIFGAKAAGGYYHAKRIICLINCLSQEIRSQKNIKDKLDVYFVENYNVTKAEHLIPASEISEQISLAGKEASGTSNMKFMLNGAITLGTVDGANVEIMENVGNDNIFTFGLKSHEVDEQWKQGYNASALYSSSPRLRRIIDALNIGFAGQSFADIASYLVTGSNFVADPYMCLKDFGDYMRAYTDMDKAYADKQRWNKMALNNIAKSGIFASDRSIREYAKNIWNLETVEE
ncbi:MAG: glycogen/starch/alpha-glucan phosphorylase [Clostridiales bacterium]|nr:glycogen/starch/alpha-glucan phosphorylase [Clostridiales bacterium]